MKNNVIEDFTLNPLEDFTYIKPLSISYRQNGISKNWSAVKAHDSVAILLYHTQKDAFLVVKQFRPPVYMNHKEYDITYELCAGIIDKDKSLKKIAQEEIDEECGYSVPLDEIVEVTSFFTNVGVSGGRQTLFFAKIDESMKIHSGGGIESELIEIEFIPTNRAEEFIFDVTKAKTPGLMFAFCYFLKNPID